MRTSISLLGSAAVGVVAAWLTGRLMRGNGFGLLGNIVAGVVGAVGGGYLLGIGGMELGSGLAGRLIVSFIAAVIVLFVVHVLTGRRGGRRMWS